MNPGATTAPDGELVFHFIAREDVQDFKLVESLFDVLGFEGATAIRGTDVSLVAERVAPVARETLAGLQQAPRAAARPRLSGISPKNGRWGARAS